MLKQVYITKPLFAIPNLCYSKKTWRFPVDNKNILNELAIQEKEITKMEQFLTRTELDLLHTKIEIEISQVLKSIK